MGLGLLIFFIPVHLISCSPRFKPIPKDELPLFGEQTRTAEEKEKHEQLIHSIIEAAGGTEKNGFSILILAAWREIDRKKYGAAIKRFNLAWLIEPMNPEVFYGFGSIFAKTENWQESYKWNQIAAGA